MGSPQELPPQGTVDIYDLDEQGRFDVLQQLVQEPEFRTYVTESRLFFMQEGDTQSSASLSKNFHIPDDVKERLGIPPDITDPKDMIMTQDPEKFPVAGRPLPFTTVRNGYGQYGLVLGHKVEAVWNLEASNNIRGMYIPLINERQPYNMERRAYDRIPVSYQGYDVHNADVITLDSGSGMGLYSNDTSPDHSIFFSKLYEALSTSGTQFATTENPDGTKLLVVTDSEYNILHVFDTFKYETQKEGIRHMSSSEQKMQTLRAILTHAAYQFMDDDVRSTAWHLPDVDEYTLHFSRPRVEAVLDATIGDRVEVTDEYGDNPITREELMEHLMLLDRVMRVQGMRAGEALAASTAWIKDHIQTSDPSFTALVFPGETAMPLYTAFRTLYPDTNYTLIPLKHLPRDPDGNISEPTQEQIREKLKEVPMHNIVVIDVGAGADALNNVIGRKINSSVTLLRAATNKNKSMAAEYDVEQWSDPYINGNALRALADMQYMLTGLDGALDLAKLRTTIEKRHGRLPEGFAQQFVGLLAFQEGIQAGIHAAAGASAEQAVGALNQYGDVAAPMANLTATVEGYGKITEASHLLATHVAAQT